MSIAYMKIPPRWWYFKRVNGGLVLSGEDEFPERPADARPAGGTNHTPWYQEIDHVDACHVHVFAGSYRQAYERAKDLIVG